MRMGYSERPSVLIVQDDVHLMIAMTSLVDLVGGLPVIANSTRAGILALEKKQNIRMVYADLDIGWSYSALDFASAIRTRWPDLELVLTANTKPHSSSLPDRSMFFEKIFDKPELIYALGALIA